MNSILEGRTPIYLNGAPAPAWKLKITLSPLTKLVSRLSSASEGALFLQTTRACLSQRFREARWNQLAEIRNVSVVLYAQTLPDRIQTYSVVARAPSNSHEKNCQR